MTRLKSWSSPPPPTSLYNGEGEETMSLSPKEQEEYSEEQVI